MTRTKSPALAPLFVVALVVAFIMVPQLASFYVDWLWFESVELAQVFVTSFKAQAFWSLAGGLLGFLVAFVSHLAMVRATRGRVVTVSFQNQAALQLDVPKHLDRLALAAPALAAFVVGSLFAANWLKFLLQSHAAPFGSLDPVFGRDISFYVFSLPVLEIVGSGLLLTLGIALLAAAVMYFLKGALLLTNKGVSAERPAAVHLAVLGGLLFLVLAFNTFVGMHAVLSSKQGLIAGATYTDINARLPLMKLQLALAVVAAVLILANIFVRRSVLVVSGIGAYLVAAVVGGAVYPALLHKFVVAPNELVKETPYIKLNIAATRRGFGLAAVEERNISGQTGLGREDIEKNGTTIRNIRLWDHRPLLDTFSQVQEIRTYYDFTTVSNDRYLINGEYRQTMLSPRELSSDSIPTKNWINETLTFTHGYGLTLGPVTQVTPEGLPVLLVKDIPPVSSAAEITVTRPEIYYGKLSSSYVIVNTKSKEFDYPAGEDNVFTEYAGAGGVKIDSLLRKLAFTASFGSMKLLLSNDVTAASRVLYHRNIAERVGRVLPFLRLDSDPHMVVTAAGRLVWMYDAYTVSDRFPYSQPVGGGVNYIRNSVKITVDAYDGSMKFYIADPVDPIAKTIANVFPGVLRPIGEMPEDLRRHIRYPLDIFGVQTAVYSTYHMEDPQSFYNREDQWEIPVMGAEGQRAQMESYYTIMKLPGEKKEEFILMIPFTPKKKDNLSAWMVARSDGEEYGKMVVYRFPKDRLVYGPKQIVARINQDTEISRQVSLWDQRGSQVMQGTLLVIPIENSLIYVQPLYLRAETGKIPELKRVIVAYENKIAMEETLERALARIFGESAGAERVAAATGAAAAASRAPAAAGERGGRAQEHFDRAMKAQREGNWALYGEEIGRLGEIIRQLR
ncbi:MAG: UPF0182 family membrane protein [Candidatus Methylomirabilia bacterium]